MAKRKFTTPIGKVKFPNIEKPDAKGKYKISLVLDPTTQEFQDMMDAIRDEESNFEKKYRGKPHYKPNVDIIDGEKVEQKNVLMSFGSAFPMWDEKGTKIFDAKKNPIRTDIGWGSECRVAFVLSPYDQDGNVGVTRYIYGIQIISLKTSEVSADACGFGDVEGGYFHQEKVKAENPTMTPEEREAAIAENQIAWDE